MDTDVLGQQLHLEQLDLMRWMPNGSDWPVAVRNAADNGDGASDKL
jgi:hypothetical protein